MATQLQERIIRYITTNIDRSLFLSMDDSIRTAYAKANHRAEEDFKNTNPARPRAQLRRYMIDDALAGALSEGQPSVEQTVPKGEHYVVVCSGNVTLSHIELHENALARPALHRKLMARKNEILEPFTFDLFEAPPPRLDDALHVVAVVVHPRPTSEKQSEPSNILVSVPYTDWSGYHLEISMAEMLAKYEDDSSSDIIDSAWPMLRDDIKKAETDIKSG
ncbi:hypothetical protein ABMA57_15605 [Saccharospirillum sp. HFRX-1]|uniref:hypothetical protein n=1 Tax=unclassified Saccharospirillum TaxID=2633430 RepID=UPI0037167DC7